MQKINFSITINAPKEKVWEMLWNLDAYRAWTSVFAEGSYVKTDNWKEGTKVLFLDPNGRGMVSRVAANRPCEFMSFKHLGEVENGVEDTTSERVKAWAGAMENYTLKQQNGTTTLEIEMDITDEFKEVFEKIWPEALKKVKALSEGTARTVITVETEINAPLEKVWKCWTTPGHIMQWNKASDDWHCPAAENDLHADGKFSFTMAAKDGSFSFDFEGFYTEVEEHKMIKYTMADGRKAEVLFKPTGNTTKIKESFEAENTHSLEMQRLGWQAILDNFKKHTEAE